jgi:hypothetical protein
VKKLLATLLAYLARRLREPTSALGLWTAIETLNNNTLPLGARIVALTAAIAAILLAEAQPPAQQETR